MEEPTNICGRLFTGCVFSPPRTEQSGERIHEVSESLADAGISIFYFTTYHTDFLMVEDSRVQAAFDALKGHFESDSPTNTTLSLDVTKKKERSPDRATSTLFSYNVKTYKDKFQIAGINKEAHPLVTGLLLKMIFYEYDPSPSIFLYLFSLFSLPLTP